MRRLERFFRGAHAAAARMIIVVGVLLAVCIAYGASQVPTPKKGKEKVDSYTRPKPTKPIKPTVPSLNRGSGDKFFLEQADVLYALDGDSAGRQIVSGNVVFRKQGMMMYCDSAFYYPASSSLEAFGNVRMIQGDTIKVTADYASYDGFTEMARLERRNSPNQVHLEHISKGDKTRKTLDTNFLDYNTIIGEASYHTGGTMYNTALTTGQTDTLTSLIGTYNTGTRLAEVAENVYLRNGRSRLRTDRLLYHTDTQLVELVMLTQITSGADSISTSSGTYDSSLGHAILSSRSLIAHTDSTGNVVTLEGDSIVYDGQTRVSEAFMFTDPSRRAAPMVITDTARKAILIGGYGYYNDSTRLAFAERYPLLKEYSRSDTLFLRAEKVMIETIMPDTIVAAADSTVNDSVAPKPEAREHHIAKAFNRARFFRSDIQGVADSITFVSADSMLFMHRKPIVWSGERLVSGSQIQVHFNDSAPDWALLPRKGLVSEAIEEGFYNQLRAGRILALFDSTGDIRAIRANTDVQTIFLPQEKDSTYNKLVNAVGDSLAIDITNRNMDKLKLWTRGNSKVSGQVIPLMVVTKKQYYLPDFISMAGAKRFSDMDSVLQRLEKIRPTYSIYKKGWSDDLGELSFELEDYFNDPEIGIIDDSPLLPPTPPGVKSQTAVTQEDEEADDSSEETEDETKTEEEPVGSVAASVNTQIIEEEQ